MVVSVYFSAALARSSRAVSGGKTEWRLDAPDARGGIGKVDQGGQRRSVFPAAVLTDRIGGAGENELRAGGCRRRPAA